MKTLFTVFFLAVAPLAAGCGSAPPSPEALAAATQRADLSIEGMTCASCSVTVRTAVNKLEGIGTIEVDVDGGSAAVTYDPAKTSPEAIATAITGAGYTTTVSTKGS